jgi:putative nucleotidyltransferase with HDIG domain
VGISRNITQRKREQDQLRAYSERQQVLAQASRAFAEAGLDYQALLDRLAQQAAEALGDNCLIGLVSDDGEWLQLAAVHSPSPEAEAFIRAAAGRPMRLTERVGAAQVLRTGQPLLTPVVNPEQLRAAVPPEQQAEVARLGYHSALLVALRSQGKAIGTVSLTRYRPERPAFTEQDVSLAQDLADRAALAITNARLFGQLQTSRAGAQRQLDQLAALRAIDQAITASLDLRLTLTVLLDQVTAQLKVDAVDVLLLDPHQKMLTFANGRGFRSQAFERSRTRLGEGHAGRAALERRLVVADLRQERAGARTGLLNADQFVSYLGMPLIAKGQVLGVLEVFHRSRLDPPPEWLDFLSALAGQAAIALDNAALFNNLQQTNTDLKLAYEATIEGWSRALDLRDKETEGHSQRVTQLSEQLALAMGMPDKALVHLRRGALLHDIGKMGVPDGILGKPGPLTDEEWAIMRQHPLLAYQMLAPIHYLRPALEIPYCHHEKWDGSGYPRGLAGDLIPLAARIFAVVDVWDALNSDRPYRRAWPAERVRGYLRAQAGTHFDPAVVQAFLELIA